MLVLQHFCTCGWLLCNLFVWRFSHLGFPMLWYFGVVCLFGFTGSWLFIWFFSRGCSFGLLYVFIGIIRCCLHIFAIFTPFPFSGDAWFVYGPMILSYFPGWFFSLPSCPFASAPILSCGSTGFPLLLGLQLRSGCFSLDYYIPGAVHTLQWSLAVFAFLGDRVLLLGFGGLFGVLCLCVGPFRGVLQLLPPIDVFSGDVVFRCGSWVRCGCRRDDSVSIFS